MKRSVVVSPTLASLLMLLTGCGGTERDLPDLGQVSGKITIDGEPTPDVVVTFSPAGKNKGRPSTGRTDSSGNYTLYYFSDAPGAVIGKHNVFVSGYVDFDPNDPDGPMVPPPGNVPADYANIEKQVDVSEGDNEINLSYP